MKKLIFIFIALFTLTLISGCGARQNTIRYDNGSEVSDEVEATDDTAESDEATDDSTDSEDAKTDSEKEIETEEETGETPELIEAAPTGKLAVTSLDGAFLKTNLSYNVIKGSAPTDTSKITINDYQLQKYVAGSTQWSYIATTRFNTLKDGLNNYILKTYDANGDQTDSLIFSIDYDAPAIPALPDVGTNHWLILMASLILAGTYTTFRRYKWL